MAAREVRVEKFSFIENKPDDVSDRRRAIAIKYYTGTAERASFEGSVDLLTPRRCIYLTRVLYSRAGAGGTSDRFSRRGTIVTAATTRRHTGARVTRIWSSTVTVFRRERAAEGTT